MLSLTLNIKNITIQKEKRNDISQIECLILDLLIYLEEEYKVALEFKLPKSINGNNSNQTETRKNIYRDILRLNYLIKNEVNNIKKGYFLCGVNEAAYLNPGTANIYKECQVYDGRVIKVGVPLNIDEFNELPQQTKELKFKWTNIKVIDKNTVAGKFVWLKIEFQKYGIAEDLE